MMPVVTSHFFKTIKSACQLLAHDAAQNQYTFGLDEVERVIGEEKPN